MNKKEMLGAVLLAAFLFWLINHWFYWIMVGFVLTVIVSESIEPKGTKDRIRLTGGEIIITGIVSGLVLYGIDRLFASVL